MSGRSLYAPQYRRTATFAAAPLTWAKDRWPAITLAAVLLLSLIGLSPVALVGPDLDPAGTTGADGDAVKQASFVLIFLLIAWHVAATRGLGRLLEIPMPFVVVLAWCWLSLSWAVDPSVALRRVMLTTIVMASVTYAVRAMPARSALAVATGVFAAVLLADWASIPLFDYAVHHADERFDKDLAGDWRGLHSHKNEAGAFCAMAATVFVHAAWQARSRIAGPFLIAAAAAFLWLSQSKTSAGFVLVGMAIGGMAQLCGRNPVLRRIGFAAALFAVLGIAAFDALPYAAIDAVIDDPAAFTGRSQIWSTLAQYAADHFLLGSGYGSFWSIGPDSPIHAYTSSWVSTIYEAHDGYLDLQVQIGFIGLALVLALLVVRPLHILFCRPLRAGAPRWLLCSVLSFGFLHDLLESSILNRASPAWVIMVVMYVLLEDARVPRPEDARLSRREAYWL